MYNKLISKMKRHFGQEPLIIYSKHCDYYQIFPIKKDDINIYYQYLKSISIQKNTQYLNEVACCLYYLAQYKEEYKEVFTSEIIENLDYNNDPINEDYMLLIYNIIEFDKRYLKSESDKINFLLLYLERFSNLSKNQTNYLLYQYYRGWLNFRLGHIMNANTEYLGFISKYTEDIINRNLENKYTIFLKLENNLFNIKMIKYTQGEDVRQSLIFLKELYEQTKRENQYLAIRIGFELYDIYLTENNYKECADLLMNMRTILKKKLLTGDKMNNAIDFYLAIVSRLGYVGVLTNNKSYNENCIKKLKKSIEMFGRNTEQNKNKILIFKNAYSFLLTIIQVNNKERIDESMQKTVALNFKSFFLPELEKFDPNKPSSKFIINNSNFEKCIVNLLIINDMDYDVQKYWNEKIDNHLMSTVIKNNPLQQDSIMTFVLSMHYKIKKYCQSYCQSEDDNVRIKHKNNIVQLAQRLLYYLKNYGEDEILFRTQFIKGAIVDIISAYGHVLIYNKEFNQLKGLIQTIDSLERTFGINESTPSYDLICKIKGDYWLFSSLKDPNASIMHYERAYKYMRSSHPKKPIILFNIAYSYFVNNDHKNALDYLERCVHEFNSIAEKKIAADFYYRPKAINKKILLAKHMLNILNANKKK